MSSGQPATDETPLPRSAQVTTTASTPTDDGKTTPILPPEAEQALEKVIESGGP